MNLIITIISGKNFYSFHLHRYVIALPFSKQYNEIPSQLNTMVSPLETIVVE
jgi:hypothetical protein